jgi:hypothetical protein
MINISSNMDYSDIQPYLSSTTILLTEGPLDTSFGYFCLILLLGLTSGFDQPLSDSSNCTYPLTTPSLMPLSVIKITEVTLAITLPKWANKNNGFI